MRTSAHSAAILAGLLALGVSLAGQNAGTPSGPGLDLAGYWSNVFHQDAGLATGGGMIGDYGGIPSWTCTRRTSSAARETACRKATRPLSTNTSPATATASPTCRWSPTRSTHPNGDAHLIITTTIEDPEYLTQPYMYSTHFKRQVDATGWAPRPCSAR